MSRRRPLASVASTSIETKKRRGTRAHRREAKPDEPPRAPRVKAPRRRVRRVTKYLVVLLLVVASLGAGVQWVLRSSYFRVQHVTFVGLRHESSGRVLHASGLERHPTMFGISAAAIQRNLGAFPWIVSLSIAKHWPSTLVVNVEESSPVAVAFDAHHVLQYVDARGRDLGPAPLHANLPTLQYLKPKSSTWPFQRAGLAAAFVASRLPVAFSAQVAIVTEDDKGVVTLKMTTPVSFILGPATQLHAKFVAIASVIAHSTLRPGDVVDATVPDELAVTGPAPS